MKKKFHQQIFTGAPLLKAILSLCLILCATGVSAQNITLPRTRMTILEVFNTIENQTKMVFAYNSSVIDVKKSVTTTTATQPLQTVLKNVLAQTNATYEISGKRILIVTKPAEAVSTTASGNNTYTGTVIDARQQPLTGATIIVNGTQSGTVSDIDGRFSIAAQRGQQLKVSFIGYKEQIITLAAATNLEITMMDDTQTLNEVIVVGYGTVKRRDAVGAVDQVDSKQFAERSNPSISRSLQGSIPNLNISMRDGKPSRAATIDVRGMGSIGSGGSALVLIDGVEGNLETVNPQDIASISVLKDASSAAIYGARGAFGVILVTTKSAADGQVKITYSGNVSVHARTIKPNVVTDGYTWTTGYINAWNGYYNGSKQLNSTINNIVPYTDTWYAELARRSTDPSLERVRLNSSNRYEYFGNTDWTDAFYKDCNLSHEHNLSVSGSSKKVGYYVSGRFYDQDGIYRVGNERYKQYNLRAKGNIEVTDYLRLTNNMDFTIVDYHQPMLYYDNQIPQRMIEHSGQPVSLITNPDGTWTYAAVLNGYAGFAEGTTFQQEDKFNLKDKVGIEIDIIKNVLKLSGDFAYSYSRDQRERVTNMYTGHTGTESTITVNESQGSTLQNTFYNTNYMSSNAYAEFSPRLGDNNTLKILGGWNVEKKKYRTIAIKRKGITDPLKPSYGLMDGTTDDPTAGGYDWSYAGAFFRANYSYKGKYLAEFSGRYDGSSKFPDNSKWGFFPSASLGWRISEEGFMKWSDRWLDNLKLRLSAGSMGNGNINPYQYTDYLSLKTSSVVIGNSLETYTTAPGAIPLSLTWEKSTTYDIGLDVDMFGNRLSMVFDAYRRYTTDMYTVGVSLPAVYGTSAPKGNNASLRTDGWELSLGWRDSFKLANKNFSYNVKAMVWDSKSIVTKYINPTGSLDDYYEGMELGEIWGYRVEGLFRDQDDIDSHATQSFLQSSDKVARPGQVKFADLNEDGIIDQGAQTLSDHGDLEIIGNSSARYRYSFSVGVNWNGIGISTFWQGVGKKNWYPRYDSGYFWGQYNRPFGYMLTAHTGDKVYSEELDNYDTAYWPRYTAYQVNESSANRVLSVPNDRYMQNVAYLRLKSVTIDYTFTDDLCRRMHIKGLKVWLSGENLWTHSPLFKYCDNYDPEVINSGDSDFRTSVGDGYSYPMLRSVTLGLNLTF